MIVKCPKCGSIVSDRAAECPSCGEILNASISVKKPKVEEKVPEPVTEPCAVQAEPAAAPEVVAETVPVAQSVPEVQPAPPVQPVPAAQPAPEEKKKKSWKGLIWGCVAVLALAGILSLYTLAITKMGLETIKIEVHFYTKPAVNEPSPVL